MAGVLLRLFAAALVAGGLGSVGLAAHALQEARERSRFVEVLVAPVNVPMWGTPVAPRAGRFLLSDDLGPGKRASPAFPITKDDLALVGGDRPGGIAETAERRGILDGFLADLGAQGLQPAGKGEAWYSYRFRLPAR